MPDRSRNLYADFLKGLLIFLVVLGHVIQYVGYPHSSLSRNDWLWKGIYMFHMPLFIAISAYFTSISIGKHSLKQYLSQRFRLLLIPLLTWSVLIAVLVWLFGVNQEQNLIDLALQKIKDSYWFVWAILFFSLLVGILHFLKLDKVIVLVILGFSILLPLAFFPLSIIKDMTPFFVAGYLFPRFEYKKQLYRLLLKYTWLFILLSAGYYYVLSVGLFEDNFPLISVIRLSSKFVLSITFMLVMYKLYSYLSASNNVVKFISKVGRQTLGIYFIQGVIFSLIEACGDVSIPYNLHLVGTLSAFVLTIFIFMLTQWIGKSRRLRSLLLGQK